MKTQILILAFVACSQVVLGQQPTVIPGLGGGLGAGLGAFNPSFNPISAFNTNWVRPYYTAAAEGWRTYFEQLQQARNQLYQTLSNLQTTTQNASGAARDIIAQILSARPVHTKHVDDDDDDDDETHPILGEVSAQKVPQVPVVEVPTQQDVLQETQIVQTVKRPQVQADPMVRPQGQVTVTHTVTQAQPANGRQPQPVGLQGVSSATRPVTSQISGVVNTQRIPQVSSQVIPSVGSQVVPQGVPQVPNPVASWVGK